MPTIKIHNKLPLAKTMEQWEDQNAPITANLYNKKISYNQSTLLPEEDKQ